MDNKIKKAGLGLALSVVIIVVLLAVPMKPEAANPAVKSILIKSMELLRTQTKASAKHMQDVKKLNEMVKSGKVTKQQIHAIVKAKISTDLVKHKISRYQLANIMSKAPKLLPTVKGSDINAMAWGKVKQLLKKPLTLKVGTLAPKNTEWIKFPREVLNPHLKKVSGGKLSIKMYTGGVMGEDSDILRKMDTGQMDGCGCTALGVFKAAPEVSVLSLPLMFNNYKEVDHIIKKFRKEIDKEFAKKGYILGGLIDTGFFYIWTKKKITSLADIKKQKLMTWFGPVETTTYKYLGIRPTPVSVPEIVTSLNTGLVNATTGPAPWILATQAYTNLHYYVTQPIFYSPAAIIFSKKIQDRFKGKYSDNLIFNFTELMAYETGTLEEEWVKKLRVFEDKCLAAFIKHGIKPVTLNKKDMAEIEAVAKKVRNQLAGKVFSKSLMDKITAELEVYRKK